MKLREITSPVMELVTPRNISAMWSFGSLAGVCLITQILTGIFLAFYFASDISLAFDSTIHISRDVNFGWLIRSIHANGASLFFVCVYLHTGRGMYYNSFKLKETWFIGVTILFLLIFTAFMGYVLPWGQMSFWAATVITNLVSAIPYLGNTLVMWLWGGFSVSNATLVRFFALHFLLPLLISVLSILHIFFLHKSGSNNPLGILNNFLLMKFHPYFSIKDSLAFFLAFLCIGFIVLFFPNILVDPENFISANPLVTPTHIMPEWYFLPMYAILRSIPNKLGGVLSLVFSIAVLYLLPFKMTKTHPSPTQKFLFWNFIVIFVILLWIGSKPVESPYETTGLLFSFLYFCYFLF